MFDILKTTAKLLLRRGTFRSYSQFGEDAIVAPLFRNKTDGVYVDIGAYHPHLYSNTFAFYRRGWRGVVVDPNASLAMLYRVFRPRDTFVHAGVGASATKTYHQYADGAYNGFEDRQVPSRLVRTYDVPILPLADIVRQNKLSRIDLLSIDTEGMEEEVLGSYDWSVEPTVIVIESERGSPAAHLLESRGYALVAQTGLSLVFKKAGAAV